MKGQKCEILLTIFKANQITSIFGHIQYITHAKMNFPIWVETFENYLHQDSVFQLNFYKCFRANDAQWVLFYAQEPFIAWI